MLRLDQLDLKKHERVVVIIDGPNTHHASKALDLHIDYAVLRSAFKDNAYLVRAYYYTPVSKSTVHSLRPLLDWLDYNGYTVVTKEVREYTDPIGAIRTKANMDVELVVDVIELADTANIDHLILITGNGDLRPLVQAMQKRGIRVTVLSTIKTNPPFAANELRRQADQFVDLADLFTSSTDEEKM